MFFNVLLVRLALLSQVLLKDSRDAHPVRYANHVPRQCLVLLVSGLHHDFFGHINEFGRNLSVAEPVETLNDVAIHLQLYEGGLELYSLPVLFDLERLFLR